MPEDFSLAEGIDILRQIGMDVIVVDEEAIDLAPICIGCQKRIDKPADCLMESFRLGIPMHNDCAMIYDNIDKVFQTLGINSPYAMEDLEPKTPDEAFEEYNN